MGGGGGRGLRGREHGATLAACLALLAKQLSPAAGVIIAAAPHADKKCQGCAILGLGHLGSLHPARLPIRPILKPYVWPKCTYGKVGEGYAIHTPCMATTRNTLATPSTAKLGGLGRVEGGGVRKCVKWRGVGGETV